MFIQDMLHKDMLYGIWVPIWMDFEELYKHDQSIDRYVDLTHAEVGYDNVAALKKDNNRIAITAIKRGNLAYYIVGKKEVVVKTDYCCGDELRSLVQNVLREHGERNVVFLLGHDEF